MCSRIKRRVTGTKIREEGSSGSCYLRRRATTDMPYLFFNLNECGTFEKLCCLHSCCNSEIKPLMSYFQM